MTPVILDPCGTINLHASGMLVSVLSALGRDWYLPSAVEREARTYRQPDPADPGRLAIAPIDLAHAFVGGLLRRCDCEGEREAGLYLDLASRIGDGEAMGLAIAACRGWSVLTDDKKARRIAGELGVPVLGTPEIMRQWADIVSPNAVELSRILRAIERFAN